MAVVHISASNVAAAIGRHRYCKRSRQLCDLLNKQLDRRFHDIQRQMREDPEVARFLASIGEQNAVRGVAPRVPTTSDPETMRAALIARERVLERRSAAADAMAHDAAAHINDAAGAIRAAEQLEQPHVPAFTVACPTTARPHLRCCHLKSLLL